MIKAIETFNRVVKHCFSKTLKVGWRLRLRAFKVAYLATELSITTKVHIVFSHIKQFIYRFGVGLGVYSEQAFESVHHDFKK